MRPTLPFFLCLAATVAGTSAQAMAEPTRVDVRVLARGAKFLGGYAAAARVVLSDAETGQILAQGQTSGTTGDTRRIMDGKNPPGTRRSTPDSAVFHATLDLDRPRRVTLSVTGPLSQPQATTTATSTQWILPGRDLTAGDGWLMELPGLIVDLAQPVAYQRIKSGTTVPLRAGVTMLCGCALSENGPWPAGDVEVEAYVTVDGATLGKVGLRFDPGSAMFEANLPATAPGLYEVEVRAWMEKHNNAGVSRTAFFVH